LTANPIEGPINAINDLANKIKADELIRFSSPYFFLGLLIAGVIGAVYCLYCLIKAREE